MIYSLALLMRLVAALRAVMAPAAVSWPAYTGGLDLSGNLLAFLKHRWTPWIFSLGAVGELVTDQLASTTSRKVPIQFGARIVVGALGGAAARARMAAFFHRDRPAALIEDGVAFLIAVASISLVA